MPNEKQLSEKESLQLITDMIQKVKNSYHDKGVGPLLWGTVVAIASFISYLQLQFNFSLPFDIWWIVMGAIIPQIILINQDAKTQKIKRHEDAALNAVWLVYAITIFGLSFFQSVVPNASEQIMHLNGWQLIKHDINNSKPDELIKPFTPSIYSLYILIYGFPTLVTGIVKKFWPMTIGAIIAYLLFMASCFTETKYDFLLGAIAALVCWFFPGIILRAKYLKQKRANV
ncbi:MAG: hypothetical protein WCR66_01640 [Bacteroidota bacterium]